MELLLAGIAFLLIVVGVVFALRLFDALIKGKTKKDNENQRHKDSYSNYNPTTEFYLFSEKEIDNIYFTLMGESERAIKKTETLYGEAALPDFLPTNLKGTVQQTVEKQVNKPTSIQKYELCFRELRNSGKITVINDQQVENKDLDLFENLIRKLQEYKELEIPQHQIEKQKEVLASKSSLGNVLRDRIENGGTSNFFFQDYKFVIKKDSNGNLELVSKDNSSINVTVSLTLRNLTERGKAHLNKYLGYEQSFSVFGTPKILSKDQEEHVEVTPYVVF